MPELHSKYFSASASKRWMGKSGLDGCPASVVMPQKEQRDTSAADEGTMGHHFTEFTLKDRMIAGTGGDWQRYNVANYIGKTHAGWRLAEHHVNHLQGYVDFIWSLVLAGGRLYIENQVDYSQPLDVDHLEGLLRAFGTSDALVYMPDGTLWVIDLKFGKWVVDAENNSQMMLYAVGGYRRLRLIHDIKRFNLVIYQPRTSGRPDDQWACTFDRLAKFIDAAKTGAQRILEAVRQYQETGKLAPAYFNASQDNCQFCKVEKCGPRRKYGYR